MYAIFYEILGHACNVFRLMVGIAAENCYSIDV